MAMKKKGSAAIVGIMIAVLIGATAFLIGTLAGRDNERPSESSASEISTPDESNSGEISEASEIEVSGEESSESSEESKPDISGYTILEMTEDDIHRGELILVNADFEYVFSEKETESFVTVYGGNKSKTYKVKNSTLSVKPETKLAMNDMFDAFYEANNKNKNINIISGTRTYEQQEKLYNDRLETQGEEETAKFTALPGHSEHHSGYAIDLAIYDGEKSYDFNGQDEYGWINENCYKYGFIERYLKNKEDITGFGEEPWHFRYVGIPHAEIMYDEGLCMEEYIDMIHLYTSDGEHYKVGDEYEIYYVKGLTVPVPEDKEYTISGDNTDGFIVTIIL